MIPADFIVIAILIILLGVFIGFMFIALGLWDDSLKIRRKK